MKSVEQVAGAMGEDEADPAAESSAASGAAGTPPPVDLPQVQVQAQDEIPVTAETEAPADVAMPHTDSADPWAAILEAGAALLQGLASARSAGGTMPGTAPITIERDPVTGRAGVRLPLPEPAVLQRLAKAFEPWLKS